MKNFRKLIPKTLSDAKLTFNDLRKQVSIVSQALKEGIEIV